MIYKKIAGPVILIISIIVLYPQFIESAELAIALKKGIAAEKFGPSNISAANANWYYNWRSTPNSGTVPPGSEAPEYVPMISRASDVNDKNIDKLKAGKANGTYKYLLGFNEPDQSGQANMTVDQVIAAWPRLMETGLILGSPAPAWTGVWIDDFMTKAAVNNLRVDFLCLHFYRSPNAIGVLDELRKYLTDAYYKYKKPIWLTEFGAPDCSILKWCGMAPALNQVQASDYTQKVITMLDSLPFVERYAWFIDASTTPGFKYSAIFNPDSSLSQTGISFRNKKESSDIRPFSRKLTATGAQELVLARQDGSVEIVFSGKVLPYAFSLYDLRGKRIFFCTGLTCKSLKIASTEIQLPRGAYIGRVVVENQKANIRLFAW